jgi:hypothetical protein
MGDLFDPTALEGLRYLDLLRTQPVRPSVEAFEGYLDHPRPERKSLTDALKASKSPAGADILAWMLSIGWVELSGSADAGGVGITDLGVAILAIAGTRHNETGAGLEAPDHRSEQPTPAEHIPATALEPPDTPTEEGSDDDRAGYREHVAMG